MNGARLDALAVCHTVRARNHFPICSGNIVLSVKVIDYGLRL